jgi:two-component system sporulation sensor kinase A
MFHMSNSDRSRINVSSAESVAGRSAFGRAPRFFNSIHEDVITKEPAASLARLSTSLVHDLRNPLTAICIGAELLMNVDLSCPQSRVLAANIYRAAQRVERLFRDLIDVSRGNRELPEICKLVDVVQGALEQITGAAESQGMCIAVVVPDWIQLRLERKRMERVFVNMIINSVESMPNGGLLRISATSGTNDVVVDIDDTGHGVPGHIRRRLFQPFLSSNKKNGIGLGLSLSRQTVIDHGGALWLAKKAGQGALFRIRLPLWNNHSCNSAASVS